VVDSGITQDLHGAGAVTASFLKDGEAGGDSIGRCAGEGDAEGYAVFDALGAALALVCWAEVSWLSGGGGKGGKGLK